MMAISLGDGLLPPSDAIAGCLLGTAVGDALGLPYEGLNRERARRLFGPPDRFRLILGRGMVSDDTEHACLVAQSLIAAAGDEQVFLRDLSRRLRFWLLTIPAGAGKATLMAALRLWLGVSTNRSGVYSAGNGPAMRAPLLGAVIDDDAELVRFIHASTRLTHTDPRAEAGAFAIALAAQFSRHHPQISPDYYLNSFCQHVSEGHLTDRIAQAVKSLERDETTSQFTASLGLTRGVTGFVDDTVPVVIHAWLRNFADYRSAVMEIIECGGDADTTAALVGGIIGARVGPNGIPQEWRDGLLEWPRTGAWIRELASSLVRVKETGGPGLPPELSYLPLLTRNALFLGVVLTHGFYRLRPW